MALIAAIAVVDVRAGGPAGRRSCRWAERKGGRPRRSSGEGGREGIGAYLSMTTAGVWFAIVAG